MGTSCYAPILPHNAANTTPYNTPHTPQELRCAIPFRLRSRELLPQFFPPLPSRYGWVEMGPMEPGRDGTQIGEPPGGSFMASLGLPAPLTLSVGVQLAKCVFVLDQESLRT
jgi:hypothetical protein